MSVTYEPSTTLWRQPRRGAPMAERLELNSIPEPNSGCMLWLGSLSDGYGKIGTAKAHRVSYETNVGPIPDGLTLDHLCRVRCCVNPDHLEPVTNDENLKRSPLYYGHRTHCSAGHEYAEDTVRIRAKKSGTERVCLTCLDDRARKQRDRNRAAPQLAADDLRHGSWNGYNTYHCRCQACLTAGREYGRLKARRLKSRRRENLGGAS